MIGRTISHYEVVEKLGEGGMGVVYKARDSRLHRFVALKVLPHETVADPERKGRFVQEARTASALNHPNIVTVHDIDESDGVDFMAMEYIEGKTLDEVIGRRGLKLNQALKYAIQIADALAKAHSAGIVHRDLKPGNVMVTAEGHVKVLDFGLAKLTEVEARSEDSTWTERLSTEVGVIVGTASYMSPEQAQGKKVDARSDIFSFGSVLYEMLTGRKAFRRDTPTLTLAAILHMEPPPLEPSVPREVDKVVMHCLRKDPARRYQHMDDVKIALEDLKEESESGTLEGAVAGERKRGQWWLWACGFCVFLLLLVLWRTYRPKEARVSGELIRITNDAGVSSTPALSPDGKLLAYTSDRDGEGRLDLYVKQVASGPPVRLTTDGQGNVTPDFSPDGTRIVYRSSRAGGGIYVMSTLGGASRLLAPGGQDPKFSPDGSQVAYWIGAIGINAAVPGAGTIWVVPTTGGQPRQVAKNFATARHPIWSPDGTHLLLVGYLSADVYDTSSIDWWLVSPNGGDSVRTGLYDALARAGFQMRDSRSSRRGSGQSVPTPGCWKATDNQVVFSAVNGDTNNLWEIGLSARTGKVTGEAVRLTAGAAFERAPTCASEGTVAFEGADIRRGLWLLPFDSDRGTVKGSLERIGGGPPRPDTLSLSADGRYLMFASAQASGVASIWMRDLTTGNERTVAESTYRQSYPVSDSSGSRVAFAQFEANNDRVIYVTVPGGAPEKLCEHCIRATDWTKDDRSLLIFTGFPYQVNLLDLETRRQTPLLRHETYSLLYGRFSPENRWISFTVRLSANLGRIMIAPFEGPKLIPQSAWIPISDVAPDDDAIWSSDGKTLYFTSDRDGHSCLWAQRLEPKSHQPAGAPFAVQHLHGRASFDHGGWSMAGGKIALSLVETTGNIWMITRPGSR